jgi:hypothetical protein
MIDLLEFFAATNRSAPMTNTRAALETITP